MTVLLLGARWAVQAVTPASKTTGPHFTAPPGSWVLGSGAGVPVSYHPASQYWPLQLTLLAVLLALATAAAASGWRATRTRAVWAMPWSPADVAAFTLTNPYDSTKGSFTFADGGADVVQRGDQVVTADQPLPGRARSATPAADVPGIALSPTGIHSR
jgi:hypothetical protein